jgi:DNA recombination-dependent growth factor C
MGLMAASSSFTRYRVVDDVPDEVMREIPDRLVKYAFKDIDHTADERSFGWVSFEDMLDPAFTSAPPEKAHYVAFALRLDTRRIQPAVYKKHLQVAINEYLDSIRDEEKKFISKDRKAEIKEQVALKLRARTFPVPAVFDVAWNVQDNLVYFGSINNKARSLFEDIFQLTFEVSLEPLTPFFLATRIMGEEALSRIENLEPSTFSTAQGG